MSAAEFESLVALFLEGNASAEQVARLRAAMSASPALRARFQASARLHQAQLACLSHREERSTDGVMSWLHAYGQRMGRYFAHLCLLALVFVELQVTIPAEYSGLLSYVEEQVPAEETVLGAEDMPVRLITDVAQEAELSIFIRRPMKVNSGNPHAESAAVEGAGVSARVSRFLV